MSKSKRAVALIVSSAIVLFCSLMLFMTVLFTQGVVIYDPKYYEGKGPFSYTLHDWLADMFAFFLTASPFI